MGGRPYVPEAKTLLRSDLPPGVAEHLVQERDIDQSTSYLSATVIEEGIGSAERLHEDFLGSYSAFQNQFLLFYATLFYSNSCMFDLGISYHGHIVSGT